MLIGYDDVLETIHSHTQVEPVNKTPGFVQNDIVDEFGEEADDASPVSHIKNNGRIKRSTEIESKVRLKYTIIPFTSEFLIL